MDLNKAMIIGRLTRDPEVRTIPSGQTVASFAVATNLNWTDQSGQRQEKVEFHNIVAWRKLAEICGQYLKKGKKVYIEGRLQTREWKSDDGADRRVTEIVIDSMIKLASPRGRDNRNEENRAPAESMADAPVKAKPAKSAKPKKAKKEVEKVEAEDVADDIPF